MIRLTTKWKQILLGQFVLFLFPQLTGNKMQRHFFLLLFVSFLVRCLNIAGPLWPNVLGLTFNLQLLYINELKKLI